MAAPAVARGLAVAAVVAGALLLGACGARTQAVVAPAGSRLAPATSGPLRGLHGGTVSVEQHRGRVLLVNFFASDCLPCVEEVPLLARLQREHAADGFDVLGVSLDLYGALTTELFVQRYGVKYPVALATKEMFAGRTPFGPLPALPMSVLLDRRGRPAASVVGGLDEGEDQGMMFGVCCADRVTIPTACKGEGIGL